MQRPFFAINDGFHFTLSRKDDKIYSFKEHTIKIERRNAINYVDSEWKAIIGMPDRYVGDEEGYVYCICAQSKNDITRIWISKEEATILKEQIKKSTRPS